MKKYIKSKYYKSLGGDIAVGTLSGAASGATLGLPGIIGGALIGGVTGFMKGKKEQTENISLEKENRINSVNSIYTNPNPYGNVYKMGGKLSKYPNGGDIIQYNAGSHASGNDQMINKLGVPVNNPNDASGVVEKKENSLNGYIFSDTIGFNKDKEVESNSKKVTKTFAKVASQIDKKLGGRADEISKYSKDMVYKILQDKNEQVLQEKAIKAHSRFEKKYGGYLTKYTNGGYDPLLGLGTGLDFLNNSENVSIPTSTSIGLPQSTNPVSFGNKTLIPNTPGIDSNHVQRLSDSINSGSSDSTPSTPSTGNNLTDFISPAFNTIAAGISLLNKNKNYLQKYSPEALYTYKNINTNSDFSELYYKNNQGVNTANKNSQIYTPTVGNSIRANNLSTQIDKNNEISFQKNQQDIQYRFNKAQLVGQEQSQYSRLNNEYQHQYAVENSQDSAVREDKALSFVKDAVNDISGISYDKQALTIINQGLKFFQFDSKSGKYVYKNDNGVIFYSNLSPEQVKK